MRKMRSIAGWVLAGASALALAGCGSGSGGSSGMGASAPSSPAAPTTPTPPPAQATAYAARTLDSNDPSLGGTQDKNLSHGWGIAFLPGAEVWVANHASNTSTLYDGDGKIDPLVVAIPANKAGAASGPTGVVANATSNFVVTKDGKSGPATFLFDGTGGTISGWAQGVDATNAITVFDGSDEGDVFTGLAIYTQGSTNLLLAANASKGEVDVFDGSFNRITLPGGFKDPNVPDGYKPFGIQTVGTQIYVSYAHFTPGKPIEDHGAGLGFVDIFDATGTLVKRLVNTGGALNAPWGIALAPADFGKFSNDLLIGNFGDGTINVYDPGTGAPLGPLTDANGKAIAIPGLWGIAFGNNAFNQPATTLFYAAGPTATQGLYGRIDATGAASAPTSPPPTSNPSNPSNPYGN